MIYSSINDNINRLEFLKRCYDQLHLKNPSAYLNSRATIKGKSLNFNIENYMHAEQERILLELLISWAVISLESFVNHILAESIDSSEMAIIAIEKPREYRDSHYSKLSRKFNELQLKIAFIGNGCKESIAVAKALKNAINFRNTIIHDKPIDFSQYDDVAVAKILSGKKYKTISPINNDTAFVLFGSIDSAFNYLNKYAISVKRFSLQTSEFSHN